MIYFISSRDRIDSSILTSLALHCCLGPSASSLAQTSPSHVVPRFKASDLPFTLATGPSSQASSWSSSSWSHDSMSCLICNELLHHHIFTCGLISYVSHINTISSSKLSLNYQNQIRTFQHILNYRHLRFWKMSSNLLCSLPPNSPNYGFRNLVYSLNVLQQEWINKHMINSVFPIKNSSLRASSPYFLFLLYN